MTTRLVKQRVTIGALAGGAAAEQIVYTTPVLNSGELTPAGIDGSINFTAGTGTTAVVVRCRQTNLVTGTQVGASCTVTLAAGNSATIPVDFIDATQYINQAAGGQYVITIQQTGGTANGTVNEGTVEVSQQ